MASSDKLAVYQELLNRGAVPSQHKPVVDELVRRGALKSPTKGATGDIAKEADFREKLGAGGFNSRFADSISFGAYNPVAAALTSAGQTAYKGLTGQPVDPVGDYKRERDVQDELLRRARDNASGIETAAEIGLSLPFFGGAAKNALAGPARSYGGQLVDAAKAGAAYGGIYGFNSARGGIEEHAANTGQHALLGAALAPALKLGIDGAGAATNAARNATGRVRNVLTSRTPDDVAEVTSRVADFASAGVRPFGPAVTNSNTQRRTAEGLAGSLFGAPLRREAMGAVDDATAAVQRAVRDPIGNQPVSDVGEGIQNTLRRNLVDRSIPGDRVRSMADDELSRITGPIDNYGFSPPPPRVDPIQPRVVDPVRPQPVNPDTVPFDIVRPSPVRRPDVNASYPRSDAYGPPPEVARMAEKATRELEIAKATSDAALDAYESAVRARGLDLAETNQWIRTQAGRGRFDDELIGRYREMMSAQQRVQQADEAARMATNEADYAARKAWLDDVKTSRLRAENEAEALYQRQLDEATREATNATQANRSAAIRQAELEAEQRAAAETARLRAEAVAEAEAATQRAQAEAQARFAANRGTSSAFEPGLSRESYPTEFSAAYEQLYRRVPPFKRNPLGEKFELQSKTATESLLGDVALEMRSQGRLPGYKGKLYGDDNKTPDPRFLDQLKKTVDNDYINGLIDELIKRRAKAQFALSKEGMRDLITAVRREKQAAQRPPYPGVPNNEKAALLARLEGALRDDYYRFLDETGPQGARLADMSRNIDAQYKSYIENLRQPLSKMFGDKVSPIDAMNKIAKAAEDGDLRMLRGYMRVMSEKGDPQRGAGAIVAHLTNNASDLSSFVKGLKALPQESRAVMFAGNKGTEMRRSLERLERVALRLEPFEKAIKSGGGIDFTNRANIYIGLSALAHVFPALMASGGAVAASRFMSSPRYVQWMLRTAQARTPRQLQIEYGRLAALLDRDQAFTGEIANAIMGTANAGPFRPTMPDASRADAVQPFQMTPKASDLPTQEELDALWSESPTDQNGAMIEEMIRRSDGALQAPWDRIAPDARR